MDYDERVGNRSENIVFRYNVIDLSDPYDLSFLQRLDRDVVSGGLVFGEAHATKASWRSRQSTCSQGLQEFVLFEVDLDRRLDLQADRILI